MRNSIVPSLYNIMSRYKRSQGWLNISTILVVNHRPRAAHSWMTEAAKQVFLYCRLATNYIPYQPLTYWQYRPPPRTIIRFPPWVISAHQSYCSTSRCPHPQLYPTHHSHKIPQPCDHTSTMLWLACYPHIDWLIDLFHWRFRLYSRTFHLYSKWAPLVYQQTANF